MQQTWGGTKKSGVLERKAMATADSRFNGKNPAEVVSRVLFLSSGFSR
ncbi:MAG: hypothetical protein HY747_09730 [Elusimicrobia bacterium]|nr:hypothetical protein [Elusimicrobiota bacterium]